jgi:hypothetical protein
MARLRSLMTEINRLFAQGYTQQQVNQTLNQAGLTLTFETFKTMLYRARKKDVQSEGRQKPSITKEDPALTKKTASNENKRSIAEKPGAFNFKKYRDMKLERWDKPDEKPENTPDPHE